jgi:hypothetical protein
MIVAEHTADNGSRSLPDLLAHLAYTDPDRRDDNPGSDVRRVTIRNARPIAAPLSLDREGFAFVRDQSGVGNFYDEDEIRRVYYPEIDTLLKAYTGARRVVVFNHQVRRGGRQLATTGKKALAPLPVVHNDETMEHGGERLFECVPGEATELSHRRWVAINVWRPIRGPVQESPLAICDGRSIAPADCVIRQFDHHGRPRHWYLLRYNPAHRWFYFPLVQRDEVLLLKCYDSCEVGCTRFAAHAAFNDPTTPADALPRESIEARALALF